MAIVGGPGVASGLLNQAGANVYTQTPPLQPKPPTHLVGQGVSFDAVRQSIISGITSAQAEALGWNAQVRDVLPLTSVVRTGRNVVTITLPAETAYNITATETITVTIPGTALVSRLNTVVSPTFTIQVQTLVTVPTQVATGAFTGPTVIGSVTVIPTGQVATGNFGSPTVITSNTTVPTGQVATAQFGTPIVAIGVPVTGLAATGAFGSLTFVISPTITPTGQVATGQFGSLTIHIDVTVIPLGLAATGAFGTPTVFISIASNSDALLRVGSVTSIQSMHLLLTAQSATATPTGRVATGSVGQPIYTVTNQPSDALLRVGTSSLSAPAFQAAAITQDVLMTVGSLSAITGPALLSVHEQDILLTVGPSSVTPTVFSLGAVVVTVSGLEGTGQQGTVNVDLQLQTSIAGGQFAAGDTTTGIDQDDKFGPDGRTATGQVGSPIAVAVQNAVVPVPSGVARCQFGTLVLTQTGALLPPSQQAVAGRGGFGIQIGTSDTWLPEGWAAQSRLGTVAINPSQLLTLTGRAVTAGRGTPSVLLGVLLFPSGQVATSGRGSPVVTGGIGALPLGQESAGHVGVLSFFVDHDNEADGDLEWQGIEALTTVAQVGITTLALSREVFPDGLVAVGALGDQIQAHPDQIFSVAGLAATAARGTPTTFSTFTLSPVGFQVRGRVGAPTYVTTFTAHTDIGVTSVEGVGSFTSPLVITSTAFVVDDLESLPDAGVLDIVGDYTNFAQVLTAEGQPGVPLVSSATTASVIGQAILGIAWGIYTLLNNADAEVHVQGSESAAQIGSVSQFSDAVVLVDGQQIVGDYGLGATATDNNYSLLRGFQMVGVVGSVSGTESELVVVTGQEATAVLSQVSTSNGQALVPTGRVATGQVGTSTVAISITMVPTGQVALAQFKLPSTTIKFQTVLIGVGGLEADASSGDVVTLAGHIMVGRQMTGQMGNVFIQTQDNSVFLEIEGFDVTALPGDIDFEVGGDIGFEPTYFCIGDVSNVAYECATAVTVEFTEILTAGNESTNDVKMGLGLATRVKAPSYDGV